MTAHSSEPLSWKAPAPRPQWTLSEWGIVCGIFLVGFVLFPLRVVGTGLEYLPGDLVDSRLNNYILEHGYRYLIGLEPEFWHVRMFYPTRWITAYSDAHIGMLPVYASFRFVGCTPEEAFQAWFVIPFVLNYFGCVWANRRLGFGAFAASLGAYLFAYALPLATSQTQHAQLGPRFLVPIALVLGWEWIWNPSVRKLTLLGLCMVFQAYLTLYIGYFLGLLILIQALVAGIAYRRSIPWRAILRPGKREWWKRIAVLSGIGGLLLPLFVPHAIASRQHGHYPMETVQGFSPTPRSWITPAHLAWHRDWLNESFPGPADFLYPGEQQLFPGVLATLALFAGLWWLICRGRRYASAPLLGISTLTILAVLLLTTRIGGFALYDPLFYLPGVKGMRTVSRIVLVLLFPMGVLIAVFADMAMKRFAASPRGIKALVAGLIFLLLVSDHWLVRQNGVRADDWTPIHFPKSEAIARRERLVSVVQQRHPSPRLLYCFPDPKAPENEWLRLQVDAMWAAQQLGIATVNGWSGYWPHGFELYLTYSDLVWWLIDFNRTSEDILAGLVIVGEPTTDDPQKDHIARSRLPNPSHP